MDKDKNGVNEISYITEEQLMRLNEISMQIKKDCNIISKVAVFEMFSKNFNLFNKKYTIKTI